MVPPPLPPNPGYATVNTWLKPRDQGLSLWRRQYAFAHHASIRSDIAWRSFKIIEVDSNRKPVCDFIIIVFYCNLRAYLLSFPTHNANLLYSTCIQRPSSGTSIGISSRFIRVSSGRGELVLWFLVYTHVKKKTIIVGLPGIENILTMRQPGADKHLVTT